MPSPTFAHSSRSKAAIHWTGRFPGATEPAHQRTEFFSFPVPHWCSKRSICRTPLGAWERTAREARADSRSRFHFLVSAARRRALRRAREARADSRSRFHFLVSAARTGPTAPRSDGAGRADCAAGIAVSFFSFSARTGPTAPRSDGAGRADCAAGAAAAAELRRHRRWPPVPPRRRRAIHRAPESIIRAKTNRGRRTDAKRGGLGD